MVIYFLCEIYIVKLLRFFYEHIYKFQNERIHQARNTSFCGMYSFFCICRILLIYQERCIRGPPHDFPLKIKDWRIKMKAIDMKAYQKNMSRDKSEIYEVNSY